MIVGKTSPGQSHRMVSSSRCKVWKCFVFPGWADTPTFLAPKRALMVLDLPTLGYPTNPMVTLVASGCTATQHRILTDKVSDRATGQHDTTQGPQRNLVSLALWILLLPLLPLLLGDSTGVVPRPPFPQAWISGPTSAVRPAVPRSPRRGCTSPIPHPPCSSEQSAKAQGGVRKQMVPLDKGRRESAQVCPTIQHRRGPRWWWSAALPNCGACSVNTRYWDKKEGHQPEGSQQTRG